MNNILVIANPLLLFSSICFPAYDLEIKAGACLRITKCSEFEYCPTPMEHGSFTLKYLLLSLSFFSQFL